MYFYADSMQLRPGPATFSPSAKPLSPGSKLLCPGLHFHSVALRCSTLAQFYTTWHRLQVTVPRPILPLRGSTLLYSRPVLHHLAPALPNSAPAYVILPHPYNNLPLPTTVFVLNISFLCSFFFK
jgi:hypothetical protein